MTFDRTAPYGEVFGACDVVPGAKYLQNGIYYNVSGEPLAYINGRKFRAPKADTAEKSVKATLKSDGK